jgi:hypothetical protein
MYSFIKGQVEKRIFEEVYLLIWLDLTVHVIFFIYLYVKQQW